MGRRKPIVVICTIGVLLACGFLLHSGGTLNTSDSTVSDPAVNSDSVFAKPALQKQVDRIRLEVTELFRRKEFAVAERRCLELMHLLPEDPTGHYNLACALARQDQPAAAMAALRASVAKGLRNVQHLNDDTDLDSLRGRNDWADLIKAAQEPFQTEEKPVSISPLTIQDGTAVVAESNTVWDLRSRRLLTFFHDDGDERDEPVIATGTDPASVLLNEWHTEETAAGHVGVLYDNHDKDHSLLDRKLYPQLARIRYSAAAQQHNVHNGLQCLFHFNGIVMGNSSTAMVVGPFWRSQPRLAYSDSRAATILARQYFGNHIYFYPEHRDYDPGDNGAGGFGDVYPANTPYVVISQGSSGSDQVFMDAFAATLAAFQPATRSLLKQKAALMPCLQMIFRTCNKQVRTPADYLTGIAHPPVFRGSQIDKLKMVQMAHDLQVESLPPVAILEVTKEDSFQVGVDYFEPGVRGKMFTTPAAIARVCHAVQQTHHMTVSASKSFDINQQPLTWRWVVLQGNPDLVEIQPMDEKSSVVSIAVQHHTRQPIHPGSELKSSRVDIGLFADNGTHISAPAMITFWWPPNQTRSYSDDGRILAVEYASRADGGLYTDPMLVIGRTWTDRYQYDSSNQMIGWNRIRDSHTQRFSRHGHLVTQTDSAGRPFKAVDVRYSLNTTKNGTPTLVQQTGARHFTYAYRSDIDSLGTVTQD